MYKSARRLPSSNRACDLVIFRRRSLCNTGNAYFWPKGVACSSQTLDTYSVSAPLLVVGQNKGLLSVNPSWMGVNRFLATVSGWVVVGSGWVLVGLWLVLVGFWLGCGWFWLGSGWVLVGFWLGSGWVLVGFWLGSGLVVVGLWLDPIPPESSQNPTKTQPASHQNPARIQPLTCGGCRVGDERGRGTQSSLHPCPSMTLRKCALGQARGCTCLANAGGDWARI